MAKLALQTPGTEFELPFSPSGKSKGSYVLTALCPDLNKDFVARKSMPPENVPQWTLIRRQELRNTELWTYTTGDLGLVLNLIASEVSGSNQESTDSGQFAQSAFIGGPKPDGDAKVPQHPPTSVTVSTNTTEKEPAGKESASQKLRSLELGGNIAEVELPNILQSINLCKMTGRLDCYQGINQIEIFFEDGTAVHATAQGALQVEGEKMLTGDQVILDLLTWDKGTFQFNPTWTTPERTIQGRLEKLLLEGVTIRDYNKFLLKAELHLNTPFSKAHYDLPEKDLEQILISGVPIDLALQKEIYRLIDENCTIEKLLFAQPMPKTQWLPVMFNLLNCGLITVANRSSAGNRSDQLKPVDIDYKSVAVAARNLLRPETGMLSYPLFIHFLQLELARFSLTHESLTIVLFEIKAGGRTLPNTALRQIAEAFSSRAQKFDLIAHYQNFEEFVMLLPYRDTATACEFIAEFASWILSVNFEGLSPNKERHLAFGVASMPDDSNQLPLLLATAAEAKKQSLTTKQMIFTFQGLPNIGANGAWEELCAEGEAALQASDWPKAESVWTSAVEQANNFPKKDRRLAHSVDLLASVYLIQNKYEQAEPLLERTVKLKGEIFGASSLELAGSLEQLAECCYSQKKFAEAANLVHRFIDVCETLRGPEDISVANGLYNLATICHLDKKYTEAEEAYKRAIAVKKKVLGVDHAETKKLEMNYASLLKTTGRETEAMRLLKSQQSVGTGTRWPSVQRDNEGRLVKTSP